MSPHVAEPWAWYRLGGRLHLVGDHGRRDVVLTASIDRGCPILAARDQDGVLCELTAEHPIAQRIRACINARAARDPEALTALVAAFRQVIESWGPPHDDTRWSCDEDSTDCEVADPRTDNEGVRCEFHAMMKRARKALARFQGGGTG